MFLLIYAIVVTLLLIGVTAVAVVVGIRAGAQIRDYETFYRHTAEEVEGIVGMLENLMQRAYISDEPDVQNVHRVMLIFHDTLIGYRNAKNKEKEVPSQEE